MTEIVENLPPSASANPDLKWYVVHAYSGMEKAVDGVWHHLVAVGNDVYMTGGFTAAGARASVHIAKWRPRENPVNPAILSTLLFPQYRRLRVWS